MKSLIAVIVCALLLIGVEHAHGRQDPAKSALLSNLESISERVRTMAEDFPEGKLNYRPNPDVRSFGEILLHIAGTNYYYIKAATGKATGAEDPKTTEYGTRAKIARFLSASVDALHKEVETQQSTEFQEKLGTWIEAVMHVNEHYGNLVVYYRLNNMVPPTSRGQ